MNLFLIENKINLEDQSQITKDEERQFSDENRIKFFFENLSKTGFNVYNIFIETAILLNEYYLKCKDDDSSSESMKNLNITMNKRENSNTEKRKNKNCCLKY